MSRKRFIKTWLPHESARRRVRNLRQWTRWILDSTDPDVIAAGKRVIAASREEPQVEYATLHLFHAGMQMAAETRQPWHVCMHVVMDAFDQRKDADGEEVPSLTHDGRQIIRQARPEAAPTGVSFFRRLLRALIARTRRQGDETASDADQH